MSSSGSLSELSGLSDLFDFEHGRTRARIEPFRTLVSCISRPNTPMQGALYQSTECFKVTELRYSSEKHKLLIMRRNYYSTNNLLMSSFVPGW